MPFKNITLPARTRRPTFALRVFQAWLEGLIRPDDAEKLIRENRRAA